MRVLYTKYASYRRPAFRVRTTLVKDGDSQFAVKEPLCEEAKSHVLALLEAPDRLAKSHPSFKVLSGESLGSGVRFPYITSQSLEQSLSQKFESGDFAGFRSDVEAFATALRKGSIDQHWGKGELIATVFGQNFNAKALCLKPVNVDLTFSNVLLDDDGYLMIDPEWVFNFTLPVDFVLYRAIRQFASSHEAQVTTVGMPWMFECCGLDQSQFAQFDAMEAAFQKYVFGELGMTGVPEHILQGSDPVGLYAIGSKSVDLRTARVWKIVGPIRKLVNIARGIVRR